VAPIQFHDSPDRFRGKGIVFLTYYPENDPPLQGHWHLQPDGPQTPLAQLPTGLTVWEAILWARERAPRVVMRFDHPWAGGVIWCISSPDEDAVEVEFFDPRIERDDDGRVIRIGALHFD
jgi:hypothetical protein